jgi:hypothetical protein
MDRLENAGLICPQSAAALEDKHYALKGKASFYAFTQVFRRRR